MKIKKPDQESHEGGRHKYRWEDLKLEVSVERVHNNYRGLVGEVSFSDKEHGHLHEADLVLLSSSSRDTFIRALVKRTPNFSKDFNWFPYVEYVTIATKQEYRKQKVVQYNLMDKLATAKTRFCLYPYICHGAINVLYGDPGASKSYFALALDLSLITGDGRLLGRKPECKHKGLYLDWEWGADDHAVRARRLLTPFTDLLPEGIPYINCYTSIEDISEEVKQMITDQGIDFVVVDSAVYAAGNSPNEDDTVRVVRNVLNYWGITSLVLGHPTKDKGRGMRGSLMWKAMARNMWRVEMHSEPGQPTLDIALFHEKGSSMGKVKTQGYTIEFDDGADETRFVKTDPGTMAVLAASLTMKEQIDAVVSSGALNLDQLDQSGLTVEGDKPASRQVITNTLNRWEIKGHYVKLVVVGYPDKWGIKQVGNQ